jgi:hypothetical protein
MGGLIKYAVEMGSGATIHSYIPSFKKIGSGIYKLRVFTDTQAVWRSHRLSLGK